MRAALLLLAVGLLGCSDPPEVKWVNNQQSRCHAMGGTMHYDKSTRLAECFRHPIGRIGKLMFKETYVEAQ